MSDFCRKTVKAAQCDGFLEQGEPPVCSPWHVCLPFGKSLSYDGQCIRLTEGPVLPDGEYGIIVVKNGCIVDARPNPTFDYTPPPCTPAAGACGENGSTASISLQPGTCNLLQKDTAGRLGAFLVTEEGDGVILTGCGSDASPLRISAKFPESKPTVIESEDLDGVTVSGAGTNASPYRLGLKEIMANPGTYGGFSIDAYGRVTEYKQPETTSVTAIVEGPGISVANTAGVATISDAASGVQAGAYLLGGYNVYVNSFGKITSATQGINLPEQSFDPYTSSITVNALGSITAVNPINRLQDGQFGAFFSGAREATLVTFSTALTGRMRIRYKGSLPSAVVWTGLGELPAPYRVLVDGVNVPAYAQYDQTTGSITEIDVLTYGQYGPGEHTVEIAGSPSIEANPNVFFDKAFLDISIVTAVA